MSTTQLVEHVQAEATGLTISLVYSALSVKRGVSSKGDLHDWREGEVYQVRTGEKRTTQCVATQLIGRGSIPLQ